MTTSADFPEEEWRTVLEGPPTAGLMVLMAQSGGTFKETWALSKSYVEARQQHGESQLLDEIVSTKPKMDHTRYHTHEELRDAGLKHLRGAVSLLQAKATPQELDDYRRFVLNLAHNVAAAHREGGQDVSPAEQAALDEIAEALGAPAS
jgi:hypothetical protein